MEQKIISQIKKERDTETGRQSDRPIRVQIWLKREIEVKRVRRKRWKKGRQRRAISTVTRQEEKLGENDGSFKKVKPNTRRG